MDKEQFIEYKTATAQDVRDVAKYMNDYADRIQEGDIDAFFKMVDEQMILWRELLMVRMAVRQQKYNVEDNDAVDNG